MVREALEFEWLPKQSHDLSILSCQFVGVELIADHQFCLHYSILVSGAPGFPRDWYGEISSQVEQNKTQAFDQTEGGHLKERVGQYICLNSLNLLLRPIGVHEALPGLELLHDPERAMQDIGNLFSAPPVEAVQVELVQAKLGELAVLRFHGAQKGRWSSLLGVAHPKSHDTWASFQIWQTLSVAINHQSDGFAVVDPIAYLPEYHMIVVQDIVDGRAGESCLAESFYRNCGGLLEAWHSCEVPVDGVITDPSNLFWADFIGSFAPSLKRMAFAVGELVQRESDQRLAEASSFVHGGFGLEQLIAQQHRAVAKFTPTLGRGDVARDLGVFLASAQMVRIIHNTLDSGLSWGFLAGYKKADDAMRQRIIAFQRATLFQYAFRFSLWPKQRHLCEPLLETAQSTAD